MEVRRLYYEDSHIREFTATVVGCEQVEKGWQVTLDQTAFYPEGGGQACDLGTLGEAGVLDVRESGEQVVHLCDKPLAVGQTVTGRIDWDRRFDLMQQHTGEHIVSGIISRRFGWHNSGFHVGKDVMEVDFDGPIPTDALAEIEREANLAVWQNVPVKCWVPGPEELPDIPYRTKRALPWPVRIVEVPGWDICACCGVHVKYTGETGPIKILSCVKFHQGVRLELVCGRRAMEALCRIFEQNRQVSQAFSAQIWETGEAARRMNEQLSAEKFRSAGLEKRLFEKIALSYVNCKDVVHFEDGLSSAGVRELADRIAGNCSGWAAVFSGNDGAGYQVCMISRTEDVKLLGAEAAKALNGRGGGKPNAFQGRFGTTRSAIETYFNIKT